MVLVLKSSMITEMTIRNNGFGIEIIRNNRNNNNL